MLHVCRFACGSGSSSACSRICSYPYTLQNQIFPSDMSCCIPNIKTCWCFGETPDYKFTCSDFGAFCVGEWIGTLLDSSLMPDSVCPANWVFRFFDDRTPRAGLVSSTPADIYNRFDQEAFLGIPGPSGPPHSGMAPLSCS